MDFLLVSCRDFQGSEIESFFREGEARMSSFAGSAKASTIDFQVRVSLSAAEAY